MPARRKSPAAKKSGRRAARSRSQKRPKRSQQRAPEGYVDAKRAFAHYAAMLNARPGAHPKLTATEVAAYFRGGSVFDEFITDRLRTARPLPDSKVHYRLDIRGYLDELAFDLDKIHRRAHRGKFDDPRLVAALTPKEASALADRIAAWLR